MAAALPIIQGLLASGHYTKPYDEDENDALPSLVKFDNGDDWHTSGFAARFTVQAIEDALLIVDELYFQVLLDGTNTSARDHQPAGGS